jgi:hypothetical protein
MQSIHLFGCPEVYSVQDTIIIESTSEEEPVNEFRPDPRKASMYSAVLPGMGQIYNRKYWKVPLVYGGFSALAWYTMFAHDEFVRYRNALNLRTDGNPDTIDEFADDFRYTEDILIRFKDYYRRQRDRTIIWTALFYAINIIDATVDAHLFEFDIGEDLGMKIGPSFRGLDQPMVNRPGGQMGVGIRFSVNF